MSRAGSVFVGEERLIQGLVGNPEGKRPLGCGGMDWIDLAQYRDRWRVLVNAVMSLRVP
jgi:hypothetical protein